MFANRSISRSVANFINIILILSLLIGAFAFPSSVRATGAYTMTDLSILVLNSQALAINEAGLVVGHSDVVDGIHGFIWDNGLMTDLGTLGGGYSYPRDINETGSVVGFSIFTVGGSTYHAFIWEGGSMTDLGTLGGSASRAFALNNAGQVVGDSSIFGDISPHAFIWEDGVMTDLGTLGGSYSQAIAINETGQVVGTAQNAGGRYHAFIWEDGVMTDLGTLGGIESGVIDINEAGQVVGQSYTSAGERHAFIWENGVMTDLGTLGGSYSQAIAINETGQVVGYSYLPGDATAHAYLWENDIMIDLGTFGGSNAQPTAINDAGQIVGWSQLAGSEHHAFLWESGVMTDLGTLGGSYSLALDINDAGHIIGNSHLTGNSTFHAFIAVILPSTLYVVPSSAGGLTTGFCNTWANACELRYALSIAESGQEIWVKEGIYKPTGGSDRTATFTLKNGVAIYGGFVGTETLLADRDYVNNITTLSGDLNGNDGANFANNGENSYHVVTGSGTNNTAILDGFTVTAGNANDGNPNNIGAGMYNNSGSPSLTNVIFSGNSAVIWGGGMVNFSSHPSVTNVSFNGNTAGQHGGGVYNSSSSPTLTDVIFSNNTAVNGGGIYNNSSTPTLTDVTLNNNTASNSGGGMYNIASSPSLTDVTFSSNTAFSGGGMYNYFASSPVPTDVTFNNNTATYGGGMYNNASSPSLTDVNFSGNRANTHGGGVYNESGNPSLTNVTISGNSASFDGGGIYNTGILTLNYSTVANNTSDSDNNGSGNGGGIFRIAGTVDIKTSIIAGNKKGTSGITDVTADCSGTMASQGYNLIGNGTGCSLNSTGDVMVTPANVFTDVLGVLADNGGSTQTHALVISLSNPALNAIPSGTNDCGIMPFDLDQRGESRPFNTNCDIGAYEAQSVPPTTTLLTVTTNDQSLVYGNSDPVFTFMYSGFINGDDETDIDTPPTCSVTGAHVNVGNYTITCSGGVDDNYTFNYVDGNLTVGPKSLTITADNQSKRYGDVFIFTGTGFTSLGLESGDAIASVTLTSAGAPPSAPAGTYAIVPSGAVGTGLSNYTITYVNGQMTVDLRVLVVTPDDKAKIYGDVFTAFTGTITGIQPGDLITATYTSVGAPATAAVGTYPITAILNAPGSVLSNYNVILNNGSLTVTHRNLLVTPDDKVKVYGDVFTAFTGVLMGVQNGDPITATYTSLGAPTAAAVGNYPITATLVDPANKLDNYTVTLNMGALAVDSAMLTVTADNQSIVYGDLDPSFTFTYSGFAVADTSADIDTPPSCTVAGPHTDVGTYPIACSGGFDDNYTFNYVDGTLTILSNVPDLLTPANAEQLLNNQPTFDWTDVSGALSYTIQISNNIGFTGTPTSNTVTDSTYTQPTNLPADVTRYWRVQATTGVGAGPWSVIRSFVTASAPSAPTLASPGNNALVTDYSPLLDWNNSGIPAGTTFMKYELQIATDSAFASPTSVDVSGLVTNSDYTPGTDLDSNTTYYWRVRAYNTLGQYSAWSNVRNFRTALVPPTLVTPIEAEQMLVNRPTFEWDDVPGATGYRIQIANNSGFSPTLTNTVVTPSTYIRTTDLPFGVTLYWRVQSNGTNGPSAWSEVRSLVTTNPPSVPTLASPSNNTKVSGPSPFFNWNDSTLPAGVVFDHYQIQVATSNAFTTIVHDNNVAGITNSQDNTAALPPATTYYWRVRSFNTLGHASAWSTVRSVRIKFAGPTLTLPSSDATVDSLIPTFTWNAVSGATNYTIQVSKSSTFSPLVINKTAISPAYTHTTNLQAGTTYYWRVRVRGPNAYGPGDWSQVFTFTTP